MGINSGDSAFMLISAALVFLMTPALAFFYGGMSARKNVLNTIFTSFIMCGISSVLWIVIGYSLSFGKDIHGIIGGFNYLFFNNVSVDPNVIYASTIPETLFATFQMMFSIVAPALITGALVGRMKFSSLLMFITSWLFLVYYPLTHMVWGDGGLIRALGAVDFAGGNVVHISSGITGLVVCIMIGKRRGHGMVSYKPHNIPFVVLGAGLLWFGWFGFNSGSALGSGTLAITAFLTTNTSAAAGLLSWILIEKIKNGKPTLLGAATGAVVGLVAITPAAGFVPIWASLIIGALVSPICFFFMTTVKKKFGYDDALDAFGCHGIGGIWGGIATGLFANTSINPSLQGNGLFYGDTKLFVAQIISIVITIAITASMSFIIMSIIKLFMDVRVSKFDEANGLDLSEHDESAYPAYIGLD
ncbi:ammonium transporter [Clostridium gasigenes]|uniref:Ammonium transporter n=1 Tax=Clostridium gasigenes TaxID=94869 RepID=A0A1H0SNE6_9CLOT|nr:ammonium transporter [Clostridium gasigenes]MBB6623492.1 ammonium transporter [Clostridium gasigenes]MBU3089060.1 ammonium transporter [Clostridium gasigenes]SDP43271.1 ammonium transporter [Clostridium gasigenes]